MIAIFGGKSFSVSLDKIYTFDGLNLSSKLNTQKQDSKGRKPSTYIKGVDLASFDIKVMTNISHGVDPMNEFNAWIELLNKKRAYPFILGGKPLLNTKYLLNSVSSSDEKIDKQGNILSMTISLKFEEFIRAGSEKKAESNNTNTVYNALKPTEKKEFKKINLITDTNYLTQNIIGEDGKFNLSIYGGLGG